MLARAYTDLRDTEAADRELEAAYAVFSELGADLDAKAVSDQRRSALPKGLTEREAEVLELVATGFSNKESADQLGISIKTIEKHRQQVMNKLNIHETAGLTRYAIAKGIVEQRKTPESVAD